MAPWIPFHALQEEKKLEDTDYIERLADISQFKVLRNAKIGVSTRRLEEEGLYTLLKQYGKSTVNDFRGIKNQDVKAGTYEFFDMTAIQMIKRSNLETVIANGFEPENLVKAINGEKIGTRVISE